MNYHSSFSKQTQTIIKKWNEKPYYYNTSIYI